GSRLPDRRHHLHERVRLRGQHRVLVRGADRARADRGSGRRAADRPGARIRHLTAGLEPVRPRARWLAVKLAMVTGGLIVLGAAMTAVITWYRAPMDQLTGRLQHNIFDYEGLVPTAYILSAFGFAVLAGLLIRRSIPAM